MNNTYYGSLIFELSREGRRGYSLPANELKQYGMDALPAQLCREQAPGLPEVDELSVVRHYTNEQQQLWRRHRLLPPRVVHDEV